MRTIHSKQKFAAGSSAARVGRVRLILSALVVLLATSSSPWAVEGDLARTYRRYVHVTTDDVSGTDFLVQIPLPAVVLGLDEEGFRTVRIDGLANEQAAGRPELPVLVVSLGIPENAEVEIDVDRSPALELDGPPVRTAKPPPGAEETRFGSFVEPAAAPAPMSWPEREVQVEQVRFRNLRIARVKIYPCAYDAASGRLRITRRFDIRLRFTGGSGFASPSGGPLGATENRLAEQSLLNGGTVTGERQQASSTTSTDMKLGAGQPVPSFSTSTANAGVKVRVDTDGLYRITRAELEAIGFDPSAVDPRQLEVSFRGQPLPCRVSGEQDGIFDPGDFIEFYGTRNTGRFSTENVYWIEERVVGGQQQFPPRFEQRDVTPGVAPVPVSFPHAMRFEDGNEIYTYGNTGAQEGDPHFFWVWFEDSNPSPPRVMTFTHDAQVIDLDSVGATARFRAFFTGRSDTVDDPDHQVRFFVNGTAVGDSTWNGRTFHQADVAFSPSLLVEGTNQFRIDLVSITFPDAYYMDWYEIEYPRLTKALSGRVTVVRPAGAGPMRYEVTGFSAVTDPVVLDVTDPSLPLELSGFTVSGAGPYTISFEIDSGSRFLVVGDGGRLSPLGLVMDTPSTLIDDGNGADEIIIVPAGWESSLSALVAHRQSQGLRVVLANLTDVADEFAGGNVDDLAIRDFVRHAYTIWQPPAVSYVLLVGEGNKDPQNWLGESTFHHYMPIHPGVTQSLGETTTETWFGAVVGNDAVPDVAVSRFSVRSGADAATMATKIINYENAATGVSPWERNVLHVAANEQRFEDALQAASTHLPSHFTVDQEYRRAGADAASISAAFESGTVLASFFGHGNYDLWADASASFYRTSDVEALSNVGQIPFVTALNCINAFIAHPTARDSMSEVFTWLPDTGGLAMWSTSAYGHFDEFEALLSRLYERMFVDNDPFVGTATNTALVDTYLNLPAEEDLLRKMVLLGDPAGWIALDAEDDQAVDAREISEGIAVGDRDTDDDGVLDGLEGGTGTDSDADGAVNALDPDSDNDGLLDGLEKGLTVPDTDTDTQRGNFNADLDPLTTTDAVDPDTDGGGAPDGVEDVNANGTIDSGETDPLNPADDPVCSTAPVPEAGAQPGGRLMLGKSGDDLTLTWGDASGSHPCMLYRVYVAGGMDGSGGRGEFLMRGVTAQPDYVYADPAPGDERFLVVGSTIDLGEGPWGHYE